MCVCSVHRSVYNYHLTTHGISCRTGQPFTPPEQIRWCRQERIIDAYCGHCNEWINLLRKMMRQVSWKNWFLVSDGWETPS